MAAAARAIAAAAKAAAARARAPALARARCVAAAAAASGDAPTPNADAQMALLEHCARGLRSELEGAAAAVAAAGGPGAGARGGASIAPAISRLLATRPSETRSHSRFYASPHLGFAFEMEAMGAIQAQALPALGELVALAITCAEAGMVHYSLPTRIAAAAGVRSDYLTPPAPAEPGHTSPWTLHATPSLEQRVATAAKELEASGKGYATVEALFGAPQAAAVRAALESHFDARRGADASAGEMERTGAADRSQRDDVVLWLLGDERDEADAPAGALAAEAGDGGVVAPGGTLAAAATQLLRTHVLSAVRQGAPSLPLREPSEYMSKAMLAQYAAGKKGFVRHLDATAASPRADSRLVSAIYYATPPDWDPATDGGELVLYPPGSGDADSEPVTLSPKVRLSCARRRTSSGRR